MTHRPYPVPACLWKMSSWRVHACGGDPRVIWFISLDPLLLLPLCE